MKSRILTALLALLLAPTANAQVFSTIIASNPDDVEQDLPLSDGDMQINSADLQLGYYRNQRRAVGLRFIAVAIPRGATITNAHVQFMVDERDSGATNLIVTGEASDDAPPFENVAGNLASRPRTAASAAWNNIPPWTTIGATGPDQRTVDLAGIVQELVDRAGWASGNAMVLVIEPGAGCQSGQCRRTAESRNGNSAGAPSLVIEWSPPVATTTLDVFKRSEVISDPVNGGSTPKNIPGATVRYTVEAFNRGDVSVDNDSMEITDGIPAGTVFVIADFDASTPGPVAFIDGSPSSGLSYSFGGLGDPLDGVEFSDDGGLSYGYTPFDTGDGTDPAVTHLRVLPQGQFLSDPTGDPSFQVQFKVRVQ